MVEYHITKKNRKVVKDHVVNFANGYPKLSRRLARNYLAIALFQSPLAERSVTVSVSLCDPHRSLARRDRLCFFWKFFSSVLQDLSFSFPNAYTPSFTHN